MDATMTEAEMETLRKARATIAEDALLYDLPTGWPVGIFVGGPINGHYFPMDPKCVWLKVPPSVHPATHSVPTGQVAVYSRVSGDTFRFAGMEPATADAPHVVNAERGA